MSEDIKILEQQIYSLSKEEQYSLLAQVIRIMQKEEESDVLKVLEGYIKVEKDPDDAYKMTIPVLAKDWDSKEDQRWDNYEDYE